MPTRSAREGRKRVPVSGLVVFGGVGAGLGRYALGCRGGSRAGFVVEVILFASVVLVLVEVLVVLVILVVDVFILVVEVVLVFVVHVVVVFEVLDGDAV